jgi:short-chain fatty acids transporter
LRHQLQNKITLFMLNAVAKPLVKLVERYLPDPYIFVLLLSLLVFVAAIVFEQQSPLAVAQQWGDGFWGLLSFSMQMLLVLVTGFMLASTPLVSKLLDRLAMLASTAGQAIVLVTLVSLAASWLNWGFGLYPSNFKMQNSAGDKSALGKAAVGSFSGSKATTVNAA